MLHKHHKIPRYLGGTDDPENIIEVTPEEHAEIHRKLFELYGRWQDRLAWLGLAGILDSKKCREELFVAAAKDGARKGNLTRWGPEHLRLPRRKPGQSSKTPRYPKGTDGRTIREKRHWYTNGIIESQFAHADAPDSWRRGRLYAKERNSLVTTKMALNP